MEGMAALCNGTPDCVAFARQQTSDCYGVIYNSNYNELFAPQTEWVSCIKMEPSNITVYSRHFPFFWLF